MKYDPFETIRKQYGVPAKKGARVTYTGQGRPVMGTVTGIDGAHLMIRLDGHKVSFPYHPTWELQYQADAPLSETTHEAGIDALPVEWTP